MKQHKKTMVSGQGSEVKNQADNLLAEMFENALWIKNMLQEADVEMKTLAATHQAKLSPLQDRITAAGKELLSLMKKNKSILFNDTDVVNLTYGSLIHSIGDKVTIPKTALADCKEQGFNDVIKIVESLDRDKIKKWPDSKLVLIGAERKKKEEFKYDLKK
jgi:hypothetical protein